MLRGEETERTQDGGTAHIRSRSLARTYCVLERHTSAAWTAGIVIHGSPISQWPEMLVKIHPESEYLGLGFRICLANTRGDSCAHCGLKSSK